MVMSETAQIITAIGGTMLGVAAVVKALATLGPLIAAWSKYEADRHKRAMAAKKSDKTESPKETSVSPVQRRPHVRWAGTAGFLFAGNAMMYSVAFNETVTPLVLIICIGGAVTIILTLMTALIQPVFDASVTIIEGQLFATDLLSHTGLNLAEMIAAIAKLNEQSTRS